MDCLILRNNNFRIINVSTAKVRQHAFETVKVKNTGRYCTVKSGWCRIFVHS